MSEFTSETVSFGIVVSDIDRAVGFYTGALGMKQVGAFDVSPALGRDSGLSDGKPFRVQVLSLGEGPTATEVKLMQVPGTPGARPDNTFIHSTLGIRYLSVHVANIDAALERARRAGVRPIARGPVELPATLAAGVWLAVVRDPDGNMIELLGPKA